MALIWSSTPLEPLFQVARHSVHPVRISDKSQTPDEITRQRIATVRHRIRLHEAGQRDIPMRGANRDLILQQRARLGAG